MLRIAFVSALFAAIACGPLPRDPAPDAGDPDAGTPDAGEPGTPDGGPGSTLAERLCGAGGERTDLRRLPFDVRRAAPDLELWLKVGRIEVWARDASLISEDEARQYGERACAALTFDVTDLGMADDGPELTKSVRLVVLDHGAYAEATDSPGTYGVSFGAADGESDAMVIPASAIGNEEELDDTLAHELTHILTYRAAPDDWDTPWWVIEGLAVHEGARFGEQEHGVPSGYVRATVDRATGADARLTFERYGLEDQTQHLGEVGHDQAMSGFYVEWLRTRGPGEAAVEHAQRRILEAMRDSSDGDGFLESFEARLGLVHGDAAISFADFLDATADDLDARYRHTVFAE